MIDGALGPSPASAIAAALMRSYGRGSLLPYQLGADKSVMLTDDGTGAFVYGSTRWAVVGLGDPICPPNALVPTLKHAHEAARRAHCTFGIYQASRDAHDALRAAGLGRVFVVGREALIDLAHFDLSGPRRANLRHTIARFHRAGASVAWFPAGVPARELGELERAIVALDRAWRASHGPQLGFTIDRFRVADLARTATAIASDAAGAPIALVTFLPMGADEGHVVGLMRRLDGSVPGAVEACIASAATALRDKGESVLSLGLVPLDGLDPHGSMLEERLLRYAARAFRSLYDVPGLAFFKSKFDPRWEPRYAATTSRRASLLFALALLRLNMRSSPLPAIGVP